MTVLQTPSSKNSGSLVPGKVRLLSTEVIHRIAAGEVVDRPASLLKELVENSVDAGATQIQVTFVEGGLVSLQVDDNGWGMSREDLEQCVQRHATSKIQNTEDLEAILQLGFRGEALSAISSVAKLTIESFREGEGAWTLCVLGGHREALRPSSRRKGTRLLVEDLFFNVPARRKFLRRPSTEAQECLGTLESLALAHPQVALGWVQVSSRGEIESQVQLPAGSLAERFSALRGSSAGGDLIEVASASCREFAAEEGLFEMEVAVCKPPVSSRSSRSVQLIVNGRPITEKRLPYLAREAFAGLIEVGRFPYLVVSVTADPHQIDVNIHPQKKEIRWAQSSRVFSHLYRVVREALGLERSSAIPAPPPQQPSEAPSFLPLLDDSPRLASLPHFAVPTPSARVPFTALASPSLPRVMGKSSLEPSSAPQFRFSSLRVIGEVGAAWIVCESSQGLVLVDQHAAHERLQFDRCLKKQNLIRSKPLFLPIVISVPPRLREKRAVLCRALEEIGFDLGGTPDDEASAHLELIAVPEADRPLDWDDLVQGIFQELSEETSVPETLVEKIRVRVAASLACHGSVRRGQRLSVESIQSLFADLDQVDWGGLCPHGRPLWVVLSHEQMASFFHR